MRGSRVKALRRAFVARFGLPKNDRQRVIWRRAWRAYKRAWNAIPRSER